VAPGRAGDLVVNCYDEARDVVQRTRSGTCEGRVVSDAEAEAIKARRRARIRGILAEEPAPVAPGHRLRSIGSGLFVRGDGTVLTTLHGVADCAVVALSPTSGETVTAEVMATQPGADLVLLRAAIRSPGIATFAAESSPAAGAVAIVGYPDQGVPPIEPLLIDGTVTGRGSTNQGFAVLRLEARVRPGNSGGPILDDRGRVIGVVFAKIDTPGIYARTGEVIMDLGFGIPADVALAFLREHGVSYRSRATRDGPVPRDMLAHVRPFVTRVECWR
jgi:S1-C subfamily serine protease